MIRSIFLGTLLAGLLPSGTLASFQYSLTSAGSISCNDVSTGIGDVSTLFNGETVTVHLSELEWEENDHPQSEESSLSYYLYWETSVNNLLQTSGIYDLNQFGMILPTDLDVGNLTVHDSGAHAIAVLLRVGSGNYQETGRTYQSYAAAVSIIPLIVVLILAMTTQMVEFSLFTTIFIGACMVTGKSGEGESVNTKVAWSIS